MHSSNAFVKTSDYFGVFDIIIIKDQVNITFCRQSQREHKNVLCRAYDGKLISLGANITEPSCMATIKSRAVMNIDVKMAV